MNAKQENELLKKIFGEFEIVDSKEYYSPIELPKTFSEMDSYIKTNKIELVQTVVDAIETSINNGLNSVEIFTFEKSGFVVVISRSEFNENLNNALVILKKNADYCTKINRLLDILNKKGKSNVKKEKKTRTSPKKSKKRSKRNKRKSDGMDSGGTEE
jgi:hypothetical protein